MAATDDSETSIAALMHSLRTAAERMGAADAPFDEVAFRLATLRPKMVIDGFYRLLRCVAECHMAALWQAEELEHGRPVIILIHDPKLVAKFEIPGGRSFLFNPGFDEAKGLCYTDNLTGWLSDLPRRLRQHRSLRSRLTRFRVPGEVGLGLAIGLGISFGLGFILDAAIHGQFALIGAWAVLAILIYLAAHSGKVIGGRKAPQASSPHSTVMDRPWSEGWGSWG